MKRSLFTLILLAGILLSACAAPQTYPAPKPLPLSGASYEASDTAPVAIAVDASGTSHIARLECRTDDPDNCRVIYQAIRAGSQVAYQLWPPAAGYTFRNPDIAVTDSGLAIMVWQRCTITEPNTCLMMMLRSDELSGAYFMDSSRASLGTPLAVSRGEVIYSVYETPSSTGSALRFCLVSTSNNECHWVSEHDDGMTDFRTDAAAVVSSLGTLHVSYLMKSSERTWGYYADNAGDITEDMIVDPNHVRELLHVWTDDNQTFKPPVIAMETDDDYLYIALAQVNDGSDGLFTYYLPPYTLSGGINVILLDVVKNWSFYGNPSITASSSGANIVFSATTTDHPTSTEIYQVGYTPGQDDSTPFRPFPTSLAAGAFDCDPVVTQVGGWVAIGWHICGFPPERDDVYFFSNSGQIIHSPSVNMNGRGTLDMAANGELVAGVWNEIQTDGRTATWFAYNAHMLWLPVVKK